jgi:Tol biopolymer transport system component
VSSSRDGESVVYVTHPERTLWAARKDGSDKRQLTFPPMDVDGAACSPDGKWVAFRGRTRLGGNPMKIFLMPFQGGQPAAITSEDAEQGIASWSPDGKRLTFGDVPEAYEHPMGTEVIRLYDVETRSFSVLPDSGGLWTSRWSPDGRYISALTIVGQKLQLFDFETHTWRSTEAERVNNPNWSRDGRYIYYDTDAKPRALRRVRVADGQVEELINLDTFPTVVAYWWSGLAPDDSPLILRTIGAAEIYSLELKTR